MIIHRRHLALQALMWSIAFACAQDDRGEATVARPVVADAVILVKNQTAGALLIYVETDRLADVLGEVSRKSQRSFSIPSAIARSADELYLEARDSENRSVHVSSRFKLSPGIRVVWTIDRTGAAVLALN
jgi:hypothetical protein